MKVELFGKYYFNTREAAVAFAESIGAPPSRITRESAHGWVIPWGHGQYVGPKQDPLVRVKKRTP